MLVEVVLALAFFHLLFDPAADAFLDLKQVNLRVHQGLKMLQSSLHIRDLQNALLLFQIDTHMGRDGVREATRLVDTGKRRQDLSGHFFAQADVFLELLYRRLDQRGGVPLGNGVGLDLSDRRHSKLFIVVNGQHCSTITTLNQHLNGAVGQLK